MHQDHSQTVGELRAAFNSGRTLSESFRRHNLEQLLRLYEENTDQILEALADDLGKGRQEAIFFEVEYIKNEVRSTLYKLHKWMNPAKPSKNLAHTFDDVELLREPLGVVLIIGPSNYPIKLLTLPAHGAIAAGNCVIMKPSHLTPRSSALLASLVPLYLDQDCYRVVLADEIGTGLLLEQRFDYIFISCTPATGRVVAKAAARHMTPSTIQMGSKCPVYLDDDLQHLEIAVKRLVFSKMVNMGQMCMSPDYVICSPKTRDALVPLFEKCVRKLYGERPLECKDLGKIVNQANVKRLESLLRSTRGTIVCGGDVDMDNRKISPTLVVDVPFDDILMQEEIFGPILPVVLVNGPLKAVEFMKSRGEKPLALYVFSDDTATQRLFMKTTSSGAVGINDCILYAGVEDLPFGGVGNSGMGPKYHGVHSFLTFTHEKGCLARKCDIFSEFLYQGRYPPASERKIAIGNFWKRARRPINFTPIWILLALAAIICYSSMLVNLAESCLVEESSANSSDSWLCSIVRILQG